MVPTALFVLTLTKRGRSDRLHVTVTETEAQKGTEQWGSAKEELEECRPLLPRLWPLCKAPEYTLLGSHGGLVQLLKGSGCCTGQGSEVPSTLPTKTVAGHWPPKF